MFKKAVALLLVVLLAGDSALIGQCPGGRCPVPQRQVVRRAQPARIQYVQPQVQYMQPQVVYTQPVQQQVVYTQPAPPQEMPPRLTLVRTVTTTTTTEVCPCLKLGTCPCAQPQAPPPPPPPAFYVAPAPMVASYGSAGSGFGSAGSSYGSAGSTMMIKSAVGSYGNYGRSPVVRSRYVRRSSGPTWNYNGSDLAGHLARTHGIDPSGMSHAEMVAAHSDAHNSMSGYGATGRVARRGIFGRWR